MLLQPSSSSLSQKESSTLADLNLCGKVNVSKYLTCVIRCVFSEVILESKLCTYVIRFPPQWMEPEYNTILRFLIFCVNLCKCLIFVKKGPCEEEEQQDQGEFPDFISSQAPLQPSSSTLPETDFSDNTTTTTVPDSNVIPSTEDNFSDNVPSQESSAPKGSGVSVPSTQEKSDDVTDNVPLLQESSAPEESGVSVPSTQASTQEKSDNVTDNVPLLQESTPPPKESGVSVPSTVSSEVLDFSVHSQVVAPLQPQAPLQPSSSTLPETDFSDNTTTTTVPDSNVIPSTEDNFSDNVPSQESSAPKGSGVSVPSTQEKSDDVTDNVPLLQESSAPEESGVSVPSTQASTQEKSDNVTDNVPLLQESTPPPKESGVSVPSTVSSEVLDFSVHSQVVAPLQPQAPLQPSAKENVKDPLICGSAGNISFELLQHEGN